MTRRFLATIAVCALGLAFTTEPASAQAPVPAQPPAAAPAAALPDADPALWVVRDEDTTIYLFGTFHMLDGRPWFNDEIRTAFDASGELVLEAVMPEGGQAAIAQLVARYAVDPQGRPLAQRVPQPDRAPLERALGEANLGMLAAAPIDPWYASLSITVAAVQRAGLLGSNGAEGALTAAAQQRNIPIGQLESFELQMQLMDNVPEALQLFMLRATLAELARLPQIIGPALDAWSRGDIERLESVLNDPTGDNPELRRIFLAQRNANWVRWIRERMARPGTVFIAVGAGHLAGHDSVQTLLGQQGIRAERVPHQGD